MVVYETMMVEDERCSLLSPVQVVTLITSTLFHSRISLSGRSCLSETPGLTTFHIVELNTRDRNAVPS